MKELCEAGVYGISQVYTTEEIREKEHLAGDFSFVLETDGYTSFSGSWYGPVVRGFDTSDYRFGHATHGHHPDRGPSPTLIAFGPSIKEGAVLKNAGWWMRPPPLQRLLVLPWKGQTEECFMRS